MPALSTPEQLIAFLGLAPDASPDAVAAAVTKVGVNDEATIEAAIDRRYFPELIAASAAPASTATAASRADVDDLLDGATFAPRVFPTRA
jgi:hypothetical protein